MATLSHLLAVGGPNLVSGAGWDLAPLALILLLVALTRLARIPLRALGLCGEIAGGLLIDIATDALDLPFLTTAALLTLVVAFIAVRRIPSDRPPAQQV